MKAQLEKEIDQILKDGPEDINKMDKFQEHMVLQARIRKTTSDEHNKNEILRQRFLKEQLKKISLN